MLNRETRAYTSSAPCDGEVSILFAACGYAAFNLERCTSVCHCRYGYSCISFAQTGVFNSSPPAIEITSCPFATRRVPTTRGTLTRSAVRISPAVSPAPHPEHWLEGSLVDESWLTGVSLPQLGHEKTSSPSGISIASRIC